jgi:hypothetical protein
MSIKLPRVTFAEAEIESFIHESREYLPQYKSLIKLGASVKNADDATALALAVYGWMPTILRSLKISEKQLVLAHQANDVASAVATIRTFDAPPVNNSWVGSSKFLHFLNPETFPIWDSHIARAFGWMRRDQYESSTRYTSYIEAMDGLRPLAAESVSQATARIRIEFGYEVSSLRALEFLIFSDSRNLYNGRRVQA